MFLLLAHVLSFLTSSLLASVCSSIANSSVPISTVASHFPELLLATVLERLVPELQGLHFLRYYLSSLALAAAVVSLVGRSSLSSGLCTLAHNVGASRRSRTSCSPCVAGCRARPSVHSARCLCYLRIHFVPVNLVRRLACLTWMVVHLHVLM